MTLNGGFAVGLDVGTTKICAIAGRIENGRINITSVRSSPSYGLRKGIVVDIDAAADSIKRSLASVGGEGETAIGSVFVGIAGGHIKGFTGYGAIGVKGSVITEEDVERLVDSAGAVCVPVDREILHVVPAGFRVNGGNGIIDPVGMHADRLEAKVHIVTGSVTSVQSLIKCCEMANVVVDDIVLEPLASADAVLMDEERERGVALVDIGGGTTDIAIYRNGILKHTAVLALGGNHITNDIAVGLGISAGEAERIKKLYGYGMAGITDESRVIEFKGEGEETKRVPLGHLTEIIEPRCEELMMLVKKEVDVVAGEGAEGNEGSPRLSGVVLTGGTALLKGLDSMAKFIIRLPVRIGIPAGVINESLVSGPEYSTGVGLLIYGLGHQDTQEDITARMPLTPRGILERMKYWVDGHL